MNDNPAPAPSVREAAQAFLSDLSQAFDNSGCASIADWLGDEADGSYSRFCAALDAPAASRPTILPDVDHALGAIGAMKRGQPLIPEDIRAIVALAEEGARQLEQFGERFAADQRAIALWQARHFKREDGVARVPDHEDLVVWLMRLVDTTIDGPTVAEVDQVRGRLKGAMLRAPNALTADAGKIIDQLAEALRKAMRGKFLAEQRADAGGAMQPGAAALLDHLEAIGLLKDAVTIMAEPESGALSFPLLIARIEAFLEPRAAPDIATLTASPSGADAFAMMVAETRKPIWGNAEIYTPIEYSADRERPRSARDSDFAALVATARDTGLIDDEQRVVFREPGEAGQLLATKLSQLTGYTVRNSTAPKGGDYEPCPEGVIGCPGGSACPGTDQFKPVVDLHGTLITPEPIGGKNTADYDRRQMMLAINDELASYDETADDGEIGAVVIKHAPGWEWQRRVPYWAPKDRAEWWRGTYGLPYPEGHEHHGQIPIGWRRIHIIGREPFFPIELRIPTAPMRGRPVMAPIGREDGALCMRNWPGLGPCLGKMAFDTRWDAYPNNAGREIEVTCPECGADAGADR